MLCLVPVIAAALVPPRSFSRRDAATLAAASSSVLIAPAAPSFAAVKAAALPFQKQQGVKLNTGVNFPYSSFGLQVYDDSAGEKLTRIALDTGYRNFFASVLAGNQRGFAKAVKASGVPREDIFICGSVLSNRAQGYDAAYKLSERGCRENMEAFAVGGISYIDQIMLDYPGPDADSCRGQWAALEAMAAAGTTKSIAVSNFSPAQLDALKGMTTPAVNQLPYGVGFGSYYAQRGTSAAEVVRQNADRGIVVQAWSPLQRALRGRAREACAEVGQKYGVSAAQVALRWIVDTGVTYTTAATRSINGGTEARFVENLDIFGFKLTKEEIATLAAL